MLRLLQRLVCSLLLGLYAAGAAALTCQSNATGNWNSAATWTGCGGGVPSAADDVQIRNANVVTIPAGYGGVARSVTFTLSNGAASLTHAAASATLTVSGDVTVNVPSSNTAKSWNINAGSATVNGNVTLVTAQSQTGRTAAINITAGTLNVSGTAGNNGSLILNNTGNTGAAVLAVNVTGAGTINVSQSFTLSGNNVGTLASASGSTFNFTSGSTGTAATGSAITYNDLTVNKAGGTLTTSTLGTLRVNRLLTVTAGTFTVANNAVSIGGGTATAGGGMTNNGTFNSGTGTYTFATNAAQSLAGSGGLRFAGAVTISQTVTNNTTTEIVGNVTGASTLTNAAGQTLRIGGDARTLASLVATAAGNTVEYNGVAPQIANAGAYYHLTISAAGAVTLAGNISVAGDLTDNGLLDAVSGNRLVTFNGTTAQTLSGAAAHTAFYDVTVNNTAVLASRKLAVNHDITVNKTLTFTSGRIVTAAGIKVVVPQAGTIVGASGAPDHRYVAGALQKFVQNGNPNLLYEVGTEGGAEPALGYSPAYLQFNSIAGAGGNLIVFATVGDHPQLASSTLNPALSVNRYWTLTVTGVRNGAGESALGGFDANATFTFVNAAPPPPTDVDTGANTGNFEIGRYDGASWNNAALGARTSTTTQSLNVTSLGDFAIGEKTAGGAPAGGFNAMDLPTCALSGVIRTKVAGVATTLNIVALNSTRTALKTNFNGTVRVELMNAADNTGFPDANGCGPNWALVRQLTDVTFGPADNGCKATAAFAEGNVWRNLRVRITENPGKPGQTIACSGDAFAMRPASFTTTVTDFDWQAAGGGRTLDNVGATGGVVHKAGAAFTITVTPSPATATNYDGTPVISSASPLACTLPSPCVNGTLTLGAFSGTGSRVSSTASYTEAGAFDVTLVDQDFASVDAADGSPADCTGSGRYVCQGPAPRAVGRFVPDHFLVTANNAPQFRTFNTADASCSTPPAGAKRSFTYIGQRFGYAITPQALVTARNVAGGTTANYSRTLWKLTGADVSQGYTTAEAREADIIGTPVVTALNNGTGTVEVNGGDTLAYARDTVTPRAPFNADIALALSVTDASETGTTGNGTIGTQTGASFVSIAFDSGNQFRYGRLRLAPANGSQLLNLPVPLEVQYWSGSAFLTNTADHCTTLAPSNILIADANVADTLLPSETANILSAPFTLGRAVYRLRAPGAGSGADTNAGSLNLTVNLDGTLTGTTYWTTPAGTPPFSSGPVTTAGLPYLAGNWTGGTYTLNPAARATFGIRGGGEEVILFRERF